MVRVQHVTRLTDSATPAILIALSIVGWWWSVRMAATPMAGHGMASHDAAAMSMSLAAFVLAWAAMMAAMMFPAIIPVVTLYRRAAARGGAAPPAFFVSGYLAVWTAVGIPVWWLSTNVTTWVAHGPSRSTWLLGAVLLLAAAYQTTPLKTACLRQCRSPIGSFLRLGGNLHRPVVAATAGSRHALWCLGCCWALMAVLVAVGAMHLGWMAAVAVVVFAEKAVPRGESMGKVAGAVMVVVGLFLLGSSVLPR